MNRIKENSRAKQRLIRSWEGILSRNLGRPPCSNSVKTSDMMDMEQPASVMPLNAAVLVLPMDAEEAAPVES